MANSLCFTSAIPFNTPNRQGTLIDNSLARKVIRVNEAFLGSNPAKVRSFEVKAADNNPPTKINSIVCADCDGNGAKLCTQCQGTGVNSVDHFNGQFKAGGLCWLCRGKRDILCGNCNGAGFVGGFMSALDD